MVLFVKLLTPTPEPSSGDTDELGDVSPPISYPPERRRFMFWGAFLTRLEILCVLPSCRTRGLFLFERGENGDGVVIRIYYWIIYFDNKRKYRRSGVYSSFAKTSLFIFQYSKLNKLSALVPSHPHAQSAYNVLTIKRTLLYTVRLVSTSMIGYHYI
ncbi:hypothetical protein POM88_053102 [Heracleum sosnowskyi]|uniref:Uncharacterized protein n=1 Tax=Heracleum sosnowskyi TaxID=360622 RepID=A0AAD8GQB7_9APIA|nr:hypothetical protein POM88_053102 [Heracleum sosnowskyi]